MEDHPACKISRGKHGMSWSETAFVGRSTVCCINQNSIFENIFDGGCFLFKYPFCLCKRISFGLCIPASQDYLKALLTFSIGNCFKPCTKSSKPDVLRGEKGLDSPLHFPRQQFSPGQPFRWCKFSLIIPHHWQSSFSIGWGLLLSKSHFQNLFCFSHVGFSAPSLVAAYSPTMNLSLVSWTVSNAAPKNCTYHWNESHCAGHSHLLAVNTTVTTSFGL